MTGAAQMEFLPADGAVLTGTADGPASDLRLQAAARLAAHRRRRGAEPAAPDTGRSQAPGKRSSIAAAVAERYAQTPSYRAFLADHAKRAMEEAAAAAEIALRNAEAVVAAQQQLLGELDVWKAPGEFTPQTAGQAPAKRTAASENSGVSGLTVRLYEDLAPADPGPSKPNGARIETEDSRALDEEIAFRQSPVFEDYKAYLQREAEPPIPLPANLLEFPRQLVASRKARPRLAEGPLLDDTAPTGRQLRIFEVEAGQISSSPGPSLSVPEWASIHLDAHTVTEPVPAPETPLLSPLLPPRTAPFRLRAMASLLDAALVLAGLIAFAGVVAEVAGQVPGGWLAAVALAVTLLVFHVVYGLLFLSFSEQTPGMRFARIGFCTFSDENPSRSAMRTRVLAQLLAVAPLGLGVFWALLDEDGLAWHDRLSRMYQRAY